MKNSFDWTSYTIQNVQAVDTSAATIATHRANNVAIRSIYLLPKMYEQFKSWTEKNLGRELIIDEQIEFDGVNISKGDVNQRTPLLIELWSD